MQFMKNCNGTDRSFCWFRLVRSVLSISNFHGLFILQLDECVNTNCRKALLWEKHLSSTFIIYIYWTMIKVKRLLYFNWNEMKYLRCNKKSYIRWNWSRLKAVRYKRGNNILNKTRLILTTKVQLINQQIFNICQFKRLRDYFINES